MPERTSGRRGSSRLGGQLLIALLVGVLGFTVAVQIRDQEETSGYSAMRGVELVELLKSVDAANERLSGQIDDLSQTREDLRSSQNRSESATKEAELRAEQLAILAGSVGAEGPGVRLRIDDPDSSVDSGVLLDAVEELRAAGAEAIVINSSARVVAQTYFLDDETGVRVGGREVTAPYIIEAIGDPATLDEALTFRGGTVDRIVGRGGKASVTAVEKISITALADVKSPEYARPDVREDAEAQTP